MLVPDRGSCLFKLRESSESAVMGQAGRVGQSVEAGAGSTPRGYRRPPLGVAAALELPIAVANPLPAGGCEGVVMGKLVWPLASSWFADEDR